MLLKSDTQPRTVYLVLVLPDENKQNCDFALRSVMSLFLHGVKGILTPPSSLKSARVE
jgi:hypothetical protein